jgi:nanoRNase/pAp phosphatase (c-di-AMP/oligoRNAs hydrolase)
MFASDIGNLLSEDVPFAASYFDSEHSRMFSLRSRPGGLNVSLIAERYNGGGHEHAAGFKVDRDHDLAKA